MKSEVHWQQDMMESELELREYLQPTIYGTDKRITQERYVQTKRKKRSSEFSGYLPYSEVLCIPKSAKNKKIN